MLLPGWHSWMRVSRGWCSTLEGMFLGKLPAEYALASPAASCQHAYLLCGFDAVTGREQGIRYPQSSSHFGAAAILTFLRL